ncbi:hypothetical protein ACHAXT_003334 [Thalassiosira profunda]
MTVRTLAKRVSERRLSFRRHSDPDPDSSTADLSASYHRRGAGTSRRRSSFLWRGSSQRSSLRSSSFRSSFNSDASDDTPTIDPATQARAVRAAEDEKEYFRESLPSSLLEAHDARDCVAPFQPAEIVTGPKLGSGEFSDVYEVTSFSLREEFADFDHVLTDDEAKQRGYLKNREKYRETKKARYALKHLKEGYFGSHDAQSYVQAASDLALEAQFLSSLQHPNIIKLRGISSSGAAGFADGPSGFFLIIDRLQETLIDRMAKWRAPSAKSRRLARMSRSLTMLPAIPWSASKAGTEPRVRENETWGTGDEEGSRKVLDERLHVAFQISAALDYLHSHSIIFRDLKPANIGFDVRGDVKIFDFGLARVMPDDGCPNTELFEMSGAGSPRYMAPECLIHKPYNMKADCYSFAIILWEMLSGQMPYIFVRRRHELIRYVTEDNGRPLIDTTWPASIQGMMESSFDENIGHRPKMALWLDILRTTLINLREGDERDLSDTWIKRRRSFGLSEEDGDSEHIALEEAPKL